MSDWFNAYRVPNGVKADKGKERKINEMKEVGELSNQ